MPRVYVKGGPPHPHHRTLGAEVVLDPLTVAVGRPARRQVVVDGVLRQVPVVGAGGHRGAAGSDLDERPARGGRGGRRRGRAHGGPGRRRGGGRGRGRRPGADAAGAHLAPPGHADVVEADVLVAERRPAVQAAIDAELERVVAAAVVPRVLPAGG